MTELATSYIRDDSKYYKSQAYPLYFLSFFLLT